MASGHTPGPAPKGLRGVGNPILRKRQTLPSSWDWRTQGYVSPVQNQVNQSYTILRSNVHVTLVREHTLFSNVIVSPVQNQVKQSYAILRSYVHVTLVREHTLFSNVIVKLGSIFITKTCNINK